MATTFTPWIVPSTERRTRTAAAELISPAASMAPVAAADAASSMLMLVSFATVMAPSTAPTAAAPWGIGAGTEQVVELDRLGLEDGDVYSMQLFYANRAPDDSEFHLRTNVELFSDDVVVTVSLPFD